MNKDTITLSYKEKQALKYILGESLEENDNNTTFAQRVKNVAKRGLLTASLVLALLPNLNAQQQTEVTKQYTQQSIGINSNKNQKEQFLNLMCNLFKEHRLKMNKDGSWIKDGTITICGVQTKSKSYAQQNVNHYVNQCIALGCENIDTHAYLDKDTNLYHFEVTLKLPMLQKTATLENKQYKTMNKEELRNKIMKGLSNSLNESKAFDPKNNKVHREAYNSFVKWYNRWKEKLGREEIRALVKKVTNDALGDNLDMINEAYKMPNPIVNTYTGPLPKVDSDDNTIYDEETGETIATIGEYGIIKFKPGLSLQDKLNYRDAILKNRTLKSWFNIDKSSFIYHQPELFESLNESGIPGPEDDHLAFDLFLTFQNTRELHDLSQPMINNLIKRLRKGEELSIDVLAASSIVEKYTRATIEEYKRTVDGAPSVVNTSTRKNLKRRIAQDLINDAKDDYAFELHDI